MTRTNGASLGLAISALSIALGFLAGVSMYSGRLATVEAEYREVAQMETDVRALRADMAKVTAHLGIETTALAPLTTPSMSTVIWRRALSQIVYRR